MNKHMGPEDRLAAHVRDNKNPGNSMNGLADSAMGGVTVSFLAQVFRIDNNTVKRRLANCPVLHSRKRGTTQTQHLYDLATAASYLIEPNVDPAEIIKSMRREDLPNAINAAYWEAQLKRQKWEENAGELWRTERIREVLGSTFQTIKFTIQLWEDTLERQTGLTENQRAALETMTDSLQAEIYDALVKNKEIAQTGPQLAEMSEMVNEVLTGEILDEDDKLDDETLSLI